ncbi:MAG: indole-3-glycerol-phosphate synthase [Alphaproteobacteria bacterium]|nr:MAG: indole-3-glycerol-phosphate synthase [Alphaproteobacteria bacterium]
MSSFLQKIYGITQERVAAAKKTMPVSVLEKEPFFSRKTGDVKKAFLQDDYNIIAEIKFASPSEGSIHPPGNPVPVASGYLDAGARMLSILTEPQYFKGDLEYLKAVRQARPEALLLRKDFMVDPYQMHEAKAYGADAILLIVAMTDEALTRDLFQAARALKLTPLVEVHAEDELNAALKLGADVIGVNNRNLKTLKTDLNIGRSLAQRKPKDSVFICESGLSTAEDLRSMRSLGYDGFLMGTHFMRRDNPGAALLELKEQLCA